MQEQLDVIWRETLNIIRGRLNKPTFKTWFENTAPISIFENTLVISAPNAFAKDWLESRYGALLTEALSQVMGEHMGIKVAIPSKQKRGAAQAKHQQLAAQDSKNHARPEARPQCRTHSRESRSNGFLSPRYTFESFVIGASNRFAHAATLAVAEKPSEAYNPLFVYGGVGLGKTHLLQAVAHYTLKHHPSLKVKYVSTEAFTNDFINSIREKGQIVGFQKRYRKNDVLLIDDIHFLENKEATQEEFFHTFNTLYEANKQIVISSDRPPKDIATLEDRLRSRFEWGLMTDIQPPDLETRIAILRQKAQFENLTVPDEVMQLIASRVQSNIRELEGALVRVVAFSSLTNQNITIDLAEEVLKDVFPGQASKPITIQTIQSEVCRYFNLPKVDLVGSKRSQSIVYPRQIAMYLARELTDLSLPKIGEEFGGRDHTTVMYAKAKVEKKISQQREIYNQVQELTNKIKRKS